MVTRMRGRTTTWPSTATGVSSTPPTARMPASGGLMIAVNSWIPNMPRLDTEKVAPVYSSGFSFFSRARPASSRTSPPIGRDALQVRVASPPA